MKIYTKTGDKGSTGLFGGMRLSKNHIRLEAYGTVDELNSSIGVIIDSLEDINLKEDLTQIQNWLFAYGAFLATQPGKNPGIELPDQATAIWMEQKIDQMELSLPPLKNFVLPNGHLSASFSHVARCVCRRAERRIVALHEVEPLQEEILVFFNRLSDYLFTLARYILHIHNIPDQPWKPRSK